ncbi:cytochrome c1 [Solimonas soli]|uniref:cytochrome c1 n=1 Tax=Solimonas soli TaxID=413479 RepID=UPI000686CC39|nr:cytochrome c1 [Solimonas soli]
MKPTNSVRKAMLKTSLKSLLAAATLVVAGQAFAEGHALPYPFKPDTGNEASVQRGARNFMNYCSGCHSMRNLRYSRVGQDLGISDDLLKANLMFTSEKVGDHILSSMPADASKSWFGQQPPDLTVEARYRGPDWVYNYLMTFYVDPSRPLGTNNLVLPGASMPHVLWELQGLQVKKAEGEHGAADGEGEHGGHEAGAPFELASKGKLTPDEYKKFVADTVNFMVYAAEPGRAHRVSVGYKVILFLLLFTVLAYFLKREYWKDVH